MIKFGFGKTPKHQQFKYIPRYYNEEKEALENRIKMNAPQTDFQSPEDEAAFTKLRIQDSLRRKQRGNHELASKTKRASNIRLMIILACLMIAAWMFIQSNLLTVILESFDVATEIPAKTVE